MKYTNPKPLILRSSKAEVTLKTGDEFQLKAGVITVGGKKFRVSAAVQQRLTASAMPGALTKAISDFVAGLEGTSLSDSELSADVDEDGVLTRQLDVMDGVFTEHQAADFMDLSKVARRFKYRADILTDGFKLVVSPNTHPVGASAKKIVVVTSAVTDELKKLASEWMKNPSEEHPVMEALLRKSKAVQPTDTSVTFEPESVEHGVVHVFVGDEKNPEKTVLEINPRTGKITKHQDVRSSAEKPLVTAAGTPSSTTSFGQLAKGRSSKKLGSPVGEQGFVKYRVKANGEEATIVGLHEGGNPPSSKREAPFGQFTRSEWNSTFRKLWSYAGPDSVMEFQPCADGTVFFYVYTNPKPLTSRSSTAEVTLKSGDEFQLKAGVTTVGDKKFKLNAALEQKLQVTAARDLDLLSNDPLTLPKPIEDALMGLPSNFHLEEISEDDGNYHVIFSVGSSHSLDAASLAALAKVGQTLSKAGHAITVEWDSSQGTFVMTLR